MGTILNTLIASLVISIPVTNTDITSSRVRGGRGLCLHRFKNVESKGIFLHILFVNHVDFGSRLLSNPASFQTSLDMLGHLQFFLSRDLVSWFGSVHTQKHRNTSHVAPVDQDTGRYGYITASLYDLTWLWGWTTWWAGTIWQTCKALSKQHVYVGVWVRMCLLLVCRLGMSQLITWWWSVLTNRQDVRV